MIIGTITLISLLFLGGVPDYFLVKDLDKGIKEYVLDKDRKNELLAEYKVGKKKLKTKDKARTAILKDLKKVNSERLSDRVNIQPYGDSLMQNMLDYQTILIQTRLQIINDITDEEWAQIVSFSGDKVTEEKAKTQEKIDKGKVKDPFDGIETSIKKQILDEQKKAEVLKSFEKFKKQFGLMSQKLSEKNVKDTPITKNKYASKDELLKVAQDVNEIRVETFQHMLDFRLDLLNNTTTEEWEKIIKSFNNIWN